MRFLALCFSVVVSGALLPSGASAATNSQSVHFAILVGNNRGDTTDRPLRYSHSDARRLHRTLKELGGFSNPNSYLILEGNVRSVQRTWKNLERKIRTIRKKTPHKKVTLLFYYSGHADRRALHLGRDKLAFTTLRKWLKTSSAHVRLAVLDTCRSGQLLQVRGKKGARRIRRQMPLPPRIRHTTTEGMAMITSSGVGEDSHELDQLRGSIFTHYLLSGLRGAADQDRDNQVSLRELYSYVYRRTISHTVFLSRGVQHPSFRNELRGHGHLILTHLQRASARLQLVPATQGLYYILNRDRTQLIAEINKRKGRKISIGLPPGQYIVVHRSPESYRVQNLQLRQGQRHKLQPQKMMQLTYLASASKGMAWLTHPKNPQRRQSSAYQAVFHASLGIAATSLVSTGVLYGLSRKYLNDAQAKLNATNSTGQLDAGLAQTSQALYISSMVSLGLTLAASTTATVFYILHRKKTPQFKQRLDAPAPSAAAKSKASFSFTSF